jgi:DNA gyrase/topoisomerase IV subunit A
MQTNDVRSIGRATQGVRLIDVEGEDQVVSIARLVEKEEDDKNGESGPPVPDEPAS